MRSDLARAPVNLQAPQRTGLEDYKKPNAGSYTGVARQPSAGRKTPQGKIVLPEFPRRTALGSGGSYASLGAAGRSTSVPRPASGSGGVTQITSGSSSAGGSNHAAAAAVAAAAATAAAHSSPRSAAPRAPLPNPASILDTLTTPSVLSGGGTRASLAQRMNSSSVMDYGTLGGGTSSSTVRIKRQAGSVSGDLITAVAPVAPPGEPSPHYATLIPSPDQLRGIYMPSPAVGTAAGGGVVTPVAASGSVGGSAASSVGRRVSMERSAVERIVSRASSFSSQNGGSYSTGPGGPPSPVASSGLSSSMAAVAPLPLAVSSSASSYHSAIDQPSRLGSGGVVYASQYAHQYGSQASTVYIPNFSQHPPPGGGFYGSTGGGSGQYAQPPRPTPLSISSGASLPPVVLSPSATGSPQGSQSPLIGSSLPTSSAVQNYHQNGSAEYAARTMQRSGNTALSTRPMVGAAVGIGSTATAAATGGAGRLRALSIAPGEDDSASTDGGSNSSLRRIQSQDEQPRWSGNGASTAGGAPYVGAAPAATPKPVVSVAAAASADYHLPAQSRIQHPQPQVPQQPHHYQYPQQQQQHQQQHTQHPTCQFHPHGHGPHPHPTGGVGAGTGGPTGAALDGSGNSYTSIASSNTSSGGNSSASGISNGGGSSSKSSVAAAGTGVSSASTSRSTSSVSHRSAADAPQAHGTQGNGRPGVSAAVAVGQPLRSGHRPTAAATSAGDGSVRSSSEAVLGGAIVRTQSGVMAVPGTSLPQQSDYWEGPTACGPLPDLPLVVAPRDAAPGRGCVGLQNLGNTCFMNSILQSLNAVPELVQQFLNPSEKHWSSKAVVAPAYSGLVRDMISGGQGICVNPSTFLRKVSKHDGRWGDGRQQDSQEFLNSLLEALQAECNRIRVKPVYRELQGKGSEEAQAAEAYDYARTWNDSIVDDIFGGLTQSTIQCHACKRLSHTFEPFLGLAVPIPGSVSGADNDGGSVSVADCLRAFVECEELQGDDSYKCEACKRRQSHSKRMQIFRPPRVLVLTLKRFAQRPAAPGLFNRFRSPAKNNTPVRLDPEPLDLTPYCNPLGLRGLCVRGRGPVAPLYQLVAVSHHSGSLEGGHYTAQARSCLDGQWYNFNDSCVRREAGRPSGSSSSAYVLFYRLANLPPPLPASSNL
ncbi:hypothetical protein VaNZ11_010332 [Volvox africanus]|uniref:ubiquitinyl hydrolase 1 n=1 Tax=Volvox africanus TaxID=51714 RepID=A0ABQ5S9B7_9CHLO|nr:hypothetical protein VaNZ11_010332 [Volvox africanus]